MCVCVCVCVCVLGGKVLDFLSPAEVPFFAFVLQIFIQDCIHMKHWVRCQASDDAHDHGFNKRVGCSGGSLS